MGARALLRVTIVGENELVDVAVVDEEEEAVSLGLCRDGELARAFVPDGDDDDDEEDVVVVVVVIDRGAARVLRRCLAAIKLCSSLVGSSGFRLAERESIFERQRCVSVGNHENRAWDRRKSSRRCGSHARTHATPRAEGERWIWHEAAVR